MIFQLIIMLLINLTFLCHFQINKLKHCLCDLHFQGLSHDVIITIIIIVAVVIILVNIIIVIIIITIIITIIRVMSVSRHFCNTRLFSNSSFSLLCSKNFEVMKLSATRYDETSVDIHPFLISNMEKSKILSSIFFRW